MKIWIDADACPVAIKEILYKASFRTGIGLTFVANQPFKIPEKENIDFIVVPPGFDVADNEIVRLMEEGDLIITGDIPLAAEVLGKGGMALNPRGELYAKDTIQGKLKVREIMATLRSGDIFHGGPPPLNKQDRKRFADQLDRILTRTFLKIK